jgi:hypothetical protein
MPNPRDAVSPRGACTALRPAQMPRRVRTLRGVDQPPVPSSARGAPASSSRASYSPRKVRSTSRLVRLMPAMTRSPPPPRWRRSRRSHRTPGHPTVPLSRSGPCDASETVVASASRRSRCPPLVMKHLLHSDEGSPHPLRSLDQMPTASCQSAAHRHALRGTVRLFAALTGGSSILDAIRRMHHDGRRPETRRAGRRQCGLTRSASLPWKNTTRLVLRGDTPASRDVVTDPYGERPAQGRMRSAATGGRRCQAKALSADRFRHCRER